VAGNVWEWTADWYTAPRTEAGRACCAPEHERGAERERSVTPQHVQFRIPRKVVKGGSHLCAPSYCFRCRPAARQPQDIGTGMSHLGFRCVVRIQ
jgi:formylglycine-generating enzyme